MSKERKFTKIDREDSYCFDDFAEEFSVILFENEYEMKRRVREKLCRVFLRVEFKKIFYIIKYDCVFPLSISVDPGVKHTSLKFAFKTQRMGSMIPGDYVIRFISFNSFLDEYGYCVPFRRDTSYDLEPKYGPNPLVFIHPPEAVNQMQKTMTTEE